ncbi:anti-sigma factor [Mycobacterium sp. CSUR Q5927]|nr:anti-sigma factor [Mycobacterium sp. CSUR Q5927]
MTTPTDDELSTLATPYALDAVSDNERADIERRLAAAPADQATAFRGEVRAVRETMAVISAGTALDPPAGLRDRVLAAVRPGPRFGWRAAGFAAAAAAVVAIAFGAGLALRPTATPPAAEQVFAAPDVRSASGAIPAGGTATVVYSRDKDVAVLVMNNVSPPAADTVYQMWLIEDQQPRSVGTIGPQAVHPSTTEIIRDLGNAAVLAFTVEPSGGSEQPTSQPFVALPLD